MVNITFTVPSVINRGGGEKKLKLVVTSLHDAFAQVAEQIGDDFRRRILDPNGNPQSLVNVYINGKNAKFSEGMNTILNNNDEVYILPAVAGG